MARIEPAALTFDNGTPYSPAFGDVYHSSESGPGQARHVFLGGNDLPRAWAGRRVFTILELGFGTGLNFLTTWAAARDDPARPQRLHFVSVEKHPFTRESLAPVHARYPELAPLASQLRGAWPVLVPGLHRLSFDDGGVSLTLAFGDVDDVLPKLRLAADAIFLDGFAPARNPAMWSPAVLKRLSRLSRRGTSIATWSTAAAVRHGLQAAGFAIEKQPGFGRKREMLAGRYEPRWPLPPDDTHGPAEMERHAIVVGTGIAGAAVAHHLEQRGWRIDAIDSLPAREQQFTGVLHPHVSADDCILSRLSRAGYFAALAHWRALDAAGHALDWQRCGALQIAQRGKPEAWLKDVAERGGYPPDYLRYLDRHEAEACAGCTVGSGGWWFPSAAWIRSAPLIAAQLAGAPGLRLTRERVEAITRRGAHWHALAGDGSTLAAAPVLILANAHDAARLVRFDATLDRVRGQVTHVPASEVSSPRVVVTGGGFVLPPIEGLVTVGSTYDHADNPLPDRRGHEQNLVRLAHLLPASVGAIDVEQLHGAAGFRCVAADRLPLAGAVPDVAAAHARRDELRGAPLRDLPRLEGLYCVTGLASRGLTWAALSAELITDLLEGEPLALESDLADAIDPARFVLRTLRNNAPGSPA